LQPVDQGRIDLDRDDRRPSFQQVLRHFAVPGADFDPAKILVKGRCRWLNAVWRNANGPSDFLAPPGIAKKVLTEPLSCHGIGLISVAGAAEAWFGAIQSGWCRANFNVRGDTMAKGYWITFYRSIKNPAALAEYAKLATPAIEAGGGKFIARGVPVKVYEAGIKERAVVIEFESVGKATATFEGPNYQAAAKLLVGAAERDIRVVEGT
jgi:uncharacterized protein (DUF1330 family)